MSEREMTFGDDGRLRVAELFAGVGGFRIGLERSDWEVVWSNQWEPSTKKQHASECYVSNFGPENHVCDDIAAVLDRVELGEEAIPDIDMLVGGFPCQDYSVAKPLNQSDGIEGKKGVLWWEIHRFLQIKDPPLLLLENVDRLLKSPARQRGRDFAIMLSCLANLGYAVEWRVINAADYGFPQRRRRVFIYGIKRYLLGENRDPLQTMSSEGVFAKAFPVEVTQPIFEDNLDNQARPFRELSEDPYEISREFGKGLKRSPFKNAGVMIDHNVWTRKVRPKKGAILNEFPHTLGDVVSRSESVPEEFYLREERMEKWEYLKGAKKEERTNRKTGASYTYSEGALPFPDPLDRPARTVLTGEGGRGPSRFKHVVQVGNGNLRRLTPEELEELNGFPRGWTESVESPVRRAFLMGNALVVGVVERLGECILDEIGEAVHVTEGQ